MSTTWKAWVIISLLAVAFMGRTLLRVDTAAESDEQAKAVVDLKKQAGQQQPPSQQFLKQQASPQQSSPNQKAQQPRHYYQPPPRPHIPPKKGRGPQCLSRATASPAWFQMEPGEMETIRAYGDDFAAYDCQLQGGAQHFSLDLSKVRQIGGHGYEVAFPDYIVADEPGYDKRSTLQLFAIGISSKTDVKPMGPAHAQHDRISSEGNGAFSHWRHPVTSGPYISTGLRFSLPGNVPLKKLTGLIAVVYPLTPPMGWIEFPHGEKKHHQEMFRELFFMTFPTVGVHPHVIDKAADVQRGTHYVWRIGGNKEFVLPLKPGELYEKRLPYQIYEWYDEFEKNGGVLFPPPESYVYYQNKVGLARLFKKAGVKTPATWVYNNLEEALGAQADQKFPVVIKDPYGFSSLGIQQAADWEEFVKSMTRYFADALPGVEAIVQSKVVALREARVTYIDGRPFHGYWRIRQSTKSASAASNMGGYQDFNFPLAKIAPIVARFANITGVPVGGVDFIWEEEEPDVTKEPYCLETSPTSDINPPAPASWKGGYAEFKNTPGFLTSYFAVRRKWTETMALAVIDRYRKTRRHLFVDIDNVISLSAARVLRWQGKAEAYSAKEVMKDEVVPDAVAALNELRSSFLIRLLTARGTYEDCFNVTQNWLAAKGFEYDELIVVSTPESKVAHMTSQTLLIDDFTLGHEKPKPFMNEKFMAELRQKGLPFVVFPFGGAWSDVMPQLMEEAKKVEV